MKFTLALLGTAAFVFSAQAEMPSAIGRKLKDYSLIPAPVLQRAVSPKFYQTLMISPIDGWVVVRGKLVGTNIYGLRVVHSEPNHANDHLALQRASEVQIAGSYTQDHPNTHDSVLIHLLLYKTADGVLALSFAHLDGPGGDQMQQWGCTRMAVLKTDGRWVDIKGPPELEGRGLVLRRKGMRDDYSTTVLKLERIETGTN